MQDYIRLACAVTPVQVGNVLKNAEDICAYMEKADAQNVDVVVFPELALTGYSCADLFFQKSLLDAALAGIKTILACSAEHPSLTAVVGLPWQIDGSLYNCAAVICGGVLQGLVKLVASSTT